MRVKTCRLDSRVFQQTFHSFSIGVRCIKLTDEPKNIFRNKNSLASHINC